MELVCHPGDDDSIAAVWGREQRRPALRVCVDGIALSIGAPPIGPAGHVVLARFCRDLAREATALAGRLAPTEGN